MRLEWINMTITWEYLDLNVNIKYFSKGVVLIKIWSLPNVFSAFGFFLWTKDLAPCYSCSDLPKVYSVQFTSQLIKCTQSHFLFLILGNSWSVYPG